MTIPSPETKWYDSHCLVHYTKSIDVVLAILERGFLLVPNKRQLIQRFLPEFDFSTREPQEFGMISFTELPAERAKSHMEAFGPFGIAVSWDWALGNGAQRVLYVGEGPIMETFQWLFRLAAQELSMSDNEEALHPMTLGNKILASTASLLYSRLLNIYEFMEPERNSSQVEWRIVSSIPYYHDTGDREQLLAHLIGLSKLGLCLVPVVPGDVEYLTCHTEDVAALKSSLPERWQHLQVFSHADSSSHPEGKKRQPAARPREGAEEARSSAEARPVSAPNTHSDRVQLPPVAKMGAVLLYPDDVLEYAHTVITYISEGDLTYELPVPFMETAQLYVYLTQMLQEPRGARLFELAARKHRRDMKDNT